MRATSVLPAGSWSGPIDEVLIDFDRRHRRRIVLTTQAGRELLIDFPQAVRLRDGDGLALEGGGIVQVRARPEPLLEIHGHDDGELVRIHVIQEMVEGLGGHVEAIDAPFDPEAGAYAPGAGHHHDHDHDHD
jgi:urease accessory protein